MADQANRQIGVTSPLGDNVLLLLRMSGSEALGRLFHYDLELLSEKGDIKLDDILGQVMTVRLEYGEDKQRFFSGHVAEFRQLGGRGRYYRYEAVLRPWLWFLTRTSDCRIFPDKSKAKTAIAPDIIKEVFREHGFTDFEDNLQGEYKPWEHCVQYRETDFNFVSRLMEQEGIYYFFKHEDGKHTLVMCDEYGSHETIEDYDTIPYFPPGGADARERDHIWDWNFGRVVQPGMYAVNDWDFMRPTASLEYKSQISRGHTQADFEMYDYPGEFVEPADGEKADKDGNDDLKSLYEKTAKTRIEELHSQFEVCKGTGNAHGLTTGALFTLDGYMRADQDREYLIVSAGYELQADPYGTEGGDASDAYNCKIGAIDAKQPFRPARKTPKPAIQGPQTAVIVGPAGDPVYTDKYGRVKVQFHWDRYGQGNEDSSCWIRVSQNWAGKMWGGMFLPHIGQEVIVEFLEGDPDRPIVTGRVYNDDNMPPLQLPTHKDKSIISDHYGNMLYFSAEKGDEHVTLFSPHHGSKFTLGKSKLDVTYSDSKSQTYGDTRSFHVGTKNSTVLGDVGSIQYGDYTSFKRGQSWSTAIGSAYSFFMGIKGSVEVGGSVSVTGAWKASATLGREYKWTLGDYARGSGSDVVLDSDQAVIIAGGKSDGTMFYSDETNIFLSVGDAARKKNFWQDHAGKILAGASALGMAAVGWAQGNSAAAEAAKFNKNAAAEQGDLDDSPDHVKIGVKKEEEELNEMMDKDWGSVKGLLAPGIAVIGAAVGSLGKSVEKPKHTTKKAEVALSLKNDDGHVNIWAGNGKETKNYIAIKGPQNTIEIKAETKILIEAPNIQIVAGTKILLDSTLTQAVGEIKNPQTDSKKQ